MADRIHTKIPSMRSCRTGTAHPPLYGVPGMAEWSAQHHAPRRHWLARILSPRASQASPCALNRVPAIEAGRDADRGEG